MCSKGSLLTFIPTFIMIPTFSAEPENPSFFAEPKNLTGLPQYNSPPPPPPPLPSSVIIGSSCSNSSSSSTSVFASIFASATNGATHSTTNFSDLVGAMGRSDRPPSESTSLRLATNGPASLLPTHVQPHDHRQFVCLPPSPHMSATALLQKATQMGATGSNSSFLREFGLAAPTGQQEAIQDGNLQRQQQLEATDAAAPMLPAGLGLGLSYQPNLVTGSTSLFGPKPATLDFLGLGMGPAGGSGNGGLSAYITSVGGSLDMSTGAAAGGPFGSRSSPVRSWEGTERRPSSPAIL